MKKRLKRSVKIIIFIFILIIVGVIGFLIYKNYNDNINEETRRNNLVNDIKSHYNKYVKCNDKCNVYDNDNNIKYVLYDGYELELNDIDINYDTKRFISDIGSIDYKDVSPIDSLSVYSDRYKRYIPFNKSIVTNDSFTLYDNSDVIKINYSLEFPIIVDLIDDYYQVEYNNRLLKINKSDVKDIINKNNSNEEIAKKITTITYHFVFDDDEKCNDSSVCRSKKKMDSDIKYLVDNKFLDLTMDEMNLVVRGYINVPRKSVLLTIDDGYFVKSSISVLEKYKVHATLFVVSSFFNNYEKFKSEYLSIQSHTDNMHKSNVCPKNTSYSQGGGILCKSDEFILNDLATSKEKLKVLNSNIIAIAYPFYDYNNNAMKLVRESGFKLAFIGISNTEGRCIIGKTDPYAIPRMAILGNESLNDFISFVNN